MQIKGRSNITAALNGLPKGIDAALRRRIDSGGLKPLPQPGAVTLSISDKFNASRLNKTMNGKLQIVAEKLANAPVTKVSTGRDGMVRGPEGQPLIPMKRDNGQKVYVDPNTNQYYVGSPAMNFKKKQTETVRGPYPLPANAQFSNSHFSDADVRAMTPKHKPSPAIPAPCFPLLSHQPPELPTHRFPAQPKVMIPLIDKKVGDGFGV